MSGIPDDPTRRHPEKPNEFPEKSVNGHDREDRDKAAKTDTPNAKPKKPDEKQKSESKH